MGATPETVHALFNAAVEASEPVVDGTLASECDVPPLPASGQDVAAFIAAERDRKLSPDSLKLRLATTRYLHRAAGYPVPTDNVWISDTLAGIRREAAKKG